MVLFLYTGLVYLDVRLWANNSQEEFREYVHQLFDLIADYYQNIKKYPVKSLFRPKPTSKSLISLNFNMS